jgi:hypothetical protein
VKRSFVNLAVLGGTAALTMPVDACLQDIAAITVCSLRASASCRTEGD